MLISFTRDQNGTMVKFSGVRVDPFPDQKYQTPLRYSNNGRNNSKKVTFGPYSSGSNVLHPKLYPNLPHRRTISLRNFGCRSRFATRLKLRTLREFYIGLLLRFETRNIRICALFAFAPPEFCVLRREKDSFQRALVRTQF